VQYAKLPVAIDDTGDPLTIPLSYHEDLVTFCVMRCHERNENWRAFELMQNEFARGLANRLTEEENPEDSYSVVRDDPWDI